MANPTAVYGAFRIESGSFPKFYGAHEVKFDNAFAATPNVVVTPNTDSPSLAGTFETIYTITANGFWVDSGNGPQQGSMTVPNYHVQWIAFGLAK